MNGRTTRRDGPGLSPAIDRRGLSGRPRRFPCCVAALAGFLLVGGPVLGQERAPTDRAQDEEAPETEAEALERVQQPFGEEPEAQARSEPAGPAGPAAPADAAGPASDTETTRDLCDGDYAAPDWQEDTREFMRDVTCHSFRWFDGRFGDDVDYPEEEVNGLALLRAEWNEYEGFDGRVRFRVRAPLPNLDNRWNLIIGRGDEDAFIQDTDVQDATFYNAGIINRNEDDSLLLGLGGRPRGGRQGWDWSAGMRLRSRPIPYVRLRWYYYKTFGPETDFRFRQTFFWRSDDGFGATARGDFSHALRPQDVLRWEAVATYSEVSLGTEWYVGQTWYHLLENRRAFSLLAFGTGETAGIEVRDTGLIFTWRQPFTRDWIWLSYGPTMTWPRFFPDDRRELSLGVTVQLEMEFGNWRY